MRRSLIACGISIALLLLVFRVLENKFFDISQVHSERASTRFLVLHQGGIGEQEFIRKLEIASNRLGWECYSCSTRIPFWGKYFRNPLLLAIKAVDPDFTLNFQSKVRYAPGINFVSLSSGANLYFGPDNHLDINTLTTFDGFLPTFADEHLLQSAIEKLGKSYRGMRWFFTAPDQPFQDIQPRRLFYCGANWDAMRKTGKYQTLFQLLDKDTEIDIYGPRNSWKNLPNSYRGSLPFDGISLTPAMQKAGIVLILHAESHIKGNSPTARIFEAAAASCIIISDSHPFVQKEFSDTVLYIDQTLSPEAMHAQIKAHLTWIKEHPAQARSLAKKAHAIFQDKFLLEAQLQNLKACVTECLHSNSECGKI